ncbi:MAG: aminotransferase class III-fold pyridoxal phosphate-dependent enzyme [Planctomycetes bacterium]|nr:aminotransferase class III-fold pyridoxal phosphate-dependent enzyme [Planctomycetota bacterium]MBI3845005.1 aminotransferase class III-fold pyridoxal phosphate-dependent enzyme [Planctomycetota bacterium]
MSELPTYSQLPVTLVRGEGCSVFDATGREFLDLYGGHAVASTGHCHPAVVAAIREQAGKLLFYSNVVGSDVRTRAASAIVAEAPPPLTHVFFVNSGTEANENAMRLARRHTGRREVVSTDGGFHGRTADAISATGMEKYRALQDPPVPEHRFVPFGDLAHMERAVTTATAAVLLEPVQSMAGVRTAPPEYFRGLRELCDRRGACLIFDEVQTGFGRTGAFFFAGRDGVVPDLVSLAKGIASGVPMGAVLVSSAIAARVKNEEYGTTFGGGMLACAAAEATVRVIGEERLLDRVREGSERLRRGALAIPGVADVRGLGYLLGIVLARDAKPVRDRLFERGVLVGGASDGKVLRLLPPLTLGPNEIDRFLGVLRECV